MTTLPTPHESETTDLAPENSDMPLSQEIYQRYGERFLRIAIALSERLEDGLFGVLNCKIQDEKSPLHVKMVQVNLGPDTVGLQFHLGIGHRGFSMIFHMPKNLSEASIDNVKYSIFSLGQHWNADEIDSGQMPADIEAVMPAVHELAAQICEREIAREQGARPKIETGDSVDTAPVFELLADKQIMPMQDNTRRLGHSTCSASFPGIA